MDRDLVIETLRPYFSERGEVTAAYLFGSLSSGTANRLSDIDIAIIVNDIPKDAVKFPYGYKAALITDLMKLLRCDKIDLVILNQASGILKHRVIRYGTLIHSTDERSRVLFESDTMNRYLDFKPMLRMRHA